MLQTFKDRSGIMWYSKITSLGLFISFINMTRFGSYKRSNKNLLLDYFVRSSFFFECDLTQYVLFINCVVKLKHRKTFQKFLWTARQR